MSVGWDVVVARVKDNNPLGTQQTLSLDFDGGSPGKLPNCKMDHF